MRFTPKRYPSKEDLGRQNRPAWAVLFLGKIGYLCPVEPPALNGILLLDKPVGPTSFAVIRAAARALTTPGTKPPKVGHAGTLDPLASGLLVVAMGTATKQLSSLVGLPKTYESTILLGESTDTLDAEGQVLETASAEHITPALVSEALGLLRGEHDYPVPLYSAVKVDGRPLYWYARNGQVPPRIPEKAMHVLSGALWVDSWEALPGGKRRAVIEVSVSSGTYIRTLAEALGQRLGVPARLDGLRRTRVGDFVVADARAPDQVTAADIHPV